MRDEAQAEADRITDTAAVVINADASTGNVSPSTGNAAWSARSCQKRS